MGIYSLPLWIHAAIQRPVLDRWDAYRDTAKGFALQVSTGVVMSLAFFTLSSRVTSAFIYFQF
jgi:hypothetical protein